MYTIIEEWKWDNIYKNNVSYEKKWNISKWIIAKQPQVDGVFQIETYWSIHYYENKSE